MKKTIKDYITVVFGTGFSRGVAFLNAIIIARFLGAGAFGKFSVFFTVLVLTRAFPEAFDATYVRYAKGFQHDADKSEFLKISILFKIIYGVFVASLSYFAAHFISYTCFQKPELMSIIILGFIGGVFQTFLMTLASVYQEKEHFGIYSILYAFYTVTVFLCIIALRFIFYNLTLANVIWIYFGVSVLVGIISIVILLKYNVKNVFSYHKEYLFQSFHLGKWIFGIMILTFLFQKLDFLFLSRFAAYKLMGVYSVAQQVVMIISVMTGSLSGIFLPKACKSLESKNAYQSFKKDAILISALINGFVILLILFAPQLILLVYGDEYAFAGVITQIILVGWFFSIIYMPFAPLFYALDDSKTKFVIECGKFVMAVILLYWLVPLKGALGAAFSISIVLIGEMIVAFVILHKKINQKLNI